jgi:hypothetical protein
MTSVLQVETSALRKLSADVVSVAEAIGALDPRDALAALVPAMNASAVAGECAGAGGRVVEAFTVLAGRVRVLAEVIDTAAVGYDAAEAQFAGELRRIGGR